MSWSQKTLDRFSFWILYLWGQLYFIRDGGAYLLDGKIIGYSWYNYLRQAWLIERRISRHYNYFREPLYGGIIGEFGEHTDSYANIGILLSSLSGSLAALFLGYTIRNCFSKNGGFWGGFASFTIFLAPGFLPIGRWGNHYTLLVLGMTLIFWSLFRAIRHSKGWIWVGLSLGFASAIDQRAFSWLLVVVFFSLLWSRNWKERFLYPLFLFLGGWGFPQFSRWFFAEDPKHRLSFTGVLAFQRDVAARWALGDVGTRTQTCFSVPVEEYLQLGFLGSDCSREILIWNWEKKLLGFSLFPLSWILVALGLLFSVAFFRRVKIFWSQNLLLSAILGSVLFWSALMPLPVRYLPSTCVGLSLIVPFFLAVLEGKRGVFWVWLIRISALFGALYLCYFGSDASYSRREMRQQVREQQKYWQIWQVVQRYQENGSFLDCGEKGLNSLILPRTYVSQPFHQVRNSSFCAEWIESGMGNWVLVDLKSPFQLKIEQRDDWKMFYRSPELAFSLWKFESPSQ